MLIEATNALVTFFGYCYHLIRWILDSYISLSRCVVNADAPSPIMSAIIKRLPQVVDSRSGGDNTAQRVVDIVRLVVDAFHPYRYRSVSRTYYVDVAM